MTRRQAVTQLQVSGDGELLAQMAEARPLAAVGHRFLQQAFARRMMTHVLFEAQGCTRREQAAAHIRDGRVGDIENARGLCWLMVGEVGAGVVMGEGGVVISVGVKSCPRRQVAAFFEPRSAVRVCV